jgi:hypothetical protein
VITSPSAEASRVPRLAQPLPSHADELGLDVDGGHAVPSPRARNEILELPVSLTHEASAALRAMGR